MNRGALAVAALAACGYPDPARHIDAGSASPIDGAIEIDAAIDASAPRRPACGSSGTWAEAAALPLPLEYLALVTGADGRIYAIGGFNDTGTGIVQGSSLVLAYTPSTDHWDQVASMPTPRGELAAVAGGDGKIYAIGGEDAPSAAATLATVEAYTPSTNQWASLTSEPTPRAAFAAALGPDGRIYALGGKSVSTTQISTVDAFSPSTNTWGSAASMFQGRSVLGATTGADGRIYAVGGYDATLQAATDEVDELTTSVGSWGGLSRLLVPMDYHQVVAVGGTIYSLGGVFGTNTASGEGEVYSIASDTWGLGPTIPTPRYGFGAAVGPDGCIYVAGGYGSNNVPLTSVEVYRP